MSKPLPRSAPEPHGVSPAAVVKFIDEIEAAKLELHSLMLLRHGSVVAEGWWKPYAPEKPHMLFSLSKSFTSTAIGFAVAEGLLSVDAPVLGFFKDEAPIKPGRHWDEMQVRHLLSMSTGHAVDTTGYMIRRRDGDWVRGFLRRPVKFKPGTHFLYNTGATYMLSVIVQKLTGQKVLDYLTPRLFGPLGIEGATWEECPRGHNTGGFGLNIKTEDIARFGQFLLQRGQWGGVQLLPAAWVDEATRKHVENGTADGTNDWGEGYGYQFWRCIPGCYRGDGAFGQYCIVVPQLDLVIAITSGLGDMAAVLRLIWDILLPAIGDRLPDNLPARSALAARLAGLSYEPPVLQDSSPLETTVAGKTYRLDSNREQRKTLQMLFSTPAKTFMPEIEVGSRETVQYAVSGDTCEVVSKYNRGRRARSRGGSAAGGTYSCTYGRNQWIESTCDTPWGQQNVAAAYGWENDATLVFTRRDLNAPFVWTEKVRIEQDTIEITQSINVSMGPTESPVVRGTPDH
ncbi:MAG: serine hydrolase domain-containing protein [Anaerolineae bacterium]